jgi:hypothetical protein
MPAGFNPIFASEGRFYGILALEMLARVLLTNLQQSVWPFE